VTETLTSVSLALVVTLQLHQNICVY